MRLAVYDDSAVFGGHEVMTLAGVRALLANGIEVAFFHAKANENLGRELAKLKLEIPKLEICVEESPSRRLQGLLTRHASGFIDALGGRLQDARVDGLLVAQGDIELSSRALVAGKKAGLRTVSYIPLPHTLEEMGARLGRFRDPFNGYLFSVPDAYITIGHEMCRRLRERGATAPIEVVYNGVDSSAPALARFDCRAALHLAPEARVLGVAGRLERRQKSQHLLIEAVAKHPRLLADVTIVLAGTGPDELHLRRLALARGLKERVHFLGWVDTRRVYPALDVLVIPSRFEGMPLVMLEALEAGIPVVGTDRDGMREMLPTEWRFRFEDTLSLAGAAAAALEDPRPDLVRHLQDKIRSEMSLTTFADNFVRTVRTLFS